MPPCPGPLVAGAESPRMYGVALLASAFPLEDHSGIEARPLIRGVKEGERWTWRTAFYQQAQIPWPTYKSGNTPYLQQCCVET